MKLLLIGLIALATSSWASSLFSSPIEEFSEKYNWEIANSRDVKEVREAVFTQWVDHYDYFNFETFDQVVYINDQYYIPGGPVLIFISATADSYRDWIENSHMVNIANQIGGVIYGLEPRYFGNSFPTEDLSLANLEKYLTVNQTMSDYVDFITFLRFELAGFGSDKFILIGHGRGGTLATWLYQRYPHLADGLWAASAPIITLFDFGLYFYNMASTFETYFPDTCQQVISEGFGELEELIEDGNIERIRELFILDPNNNFDLANPHDVALFYNQLFDSLFTPVEYGTPYTINVICQNLVPSDVFSSLELLANFYGFALYNRVFNYDVFVSALKEESLDAQPTYSRQILYVACSGWSQFKTSDLLPNPINLRFNSNMFGDLCNDVFGISANSAVDNNYRTSQENVIYSYITNAYFTNAGFDPHHIIGVTTDLNPTATHALIPRIGKLYDFFQNVYEDIYTPELQAARDQALQLITLWTRPSA